MFRRPLGMLFALAGALKAPIAEMVNAKNIDPKAYRSAKRAYRAAHSRYNPQKIVHAIVGSNHTEDEIILAAIAKRARKGATLRYTWTGAR